MFPFEISHWVRYCIRLAVPSKRNRIRRDLTGTAIPQGTALRNGAEQGETDEAGGKFYNFSHGAFVLCCKLVFLLVV